MTRRRRLFGPGHLALATGGAVLAVVLGFGTDNDAGTSAYLPGDGPTLSDPESDDQLASPDRNDLTASSSPGPSQTPSASPSPSRSRATERPETSPTPTPRRTERADRTRTTPSSTPRPTAPSAPSPSPKPTATRRTPASAPGTPASSAVHNAQESEVLRLVNVERAGSGCGPVTADGLLAQVARAHSKDMAVNKFFDHNSQDGRSPFDRMRAAGYSFSTAAENIAAGQQTASAVMESWMNSPGHRENILNCGLKELGVGMWKQSGSPYGIYWTQDFGTT
ncbi:MAG: hypothetical protein QG608_1354 [Actinomycetota bacterium]|nr:hypothetical protein [Actinomycetota bacterium]